MQQRPSCENSFQNMNVLHLKTKLLNSTHSTQQDRLKNASPKSMVRKLTEPTPSVAWTQALLGQGGKQAQTVESCWGTLLRVPFARQTCGERCPAAKMPAVYSCIQLGCIAVYNDILSVITAQGRKSQGNPCNAIKAISSKVFPSRQENVFRCVQPQRFLSACLLFCWFSAQNTETAAATQSMLCTAFHFVLPSNSQACIQKQKITDNSQKYARSTRYASLILMRGLEFFLRMLDTTHETRIYH